MHTIGVMFDIAAKMHVMLRTFTTCHVLIGFALLMWVAHAWVSWLNKWSTKLRLELCDIASLFIHNIGDENGWLFPTSTLSFPGFSRRTSRAMDTLDCLIRNQSFSCRLGQCIRREETCTTTALPWGRGTTSVQNFCWIHPLQGRCGTTWGNFAAPQSSLLHRVTFWRRHQRAGESVPKTWLTCKAWLAYASLMHYKTKWYGIN